MVAPAGNTPDEVVVRAVGGSSSLGHPRRRLAVAEAPQRLARLRPVEQLDAPMRLALERGFKQVAKALVEDPLRGRGGLRARGRDCLDPAFDRGIQLLRTDDFVREPMRPGDVL